MVCRLFIFESGGLAVFVLIRDDPFWDDGDFCPDIVYVSVVVVPFADPVLD